MQPADKALILAYAAESAERYDEMAAFMMDRVKSGGPLGQDERDLFSAAFKNKLSGRRQAVRILTGIIAAEQAPERKEMASNYRIKVQNELMEICEQCVGVLKETLVPGAAPGEMTAFYLKMLGDYYRYEAEFAGGDMKMSVAEKAKEAYLEATNAAACLPTTHPVRLGLALNFSVFQHEVLGDTQAAAKTAEDAFIRAQEDLNSVPEGESNDAILTMQLLQDNLSLWCQGQ